MTGTATPAARIRNLAFLGIVALAGLGLATPSLAQDPAQIDLVLLLEDTDTMLDNIQVITAQAPTLATYLSDRYSDMVVSTGSFVDKPVTPFGDDSGGIPVYQVLTGPVPAGDFDLPLIRYVSHHYMGTNEDGTALRLNYYESLFAGNSAGDAANGHFEALVAVIMTANFRPFSHKIVVFVTDSRPHVAGDWPTAPVSPNPLTGTPFARENADYPSVDAIRQLLALTGVIPVFAVNGDASLVQDYTDLVASLGTGIVVEDEIDSTHLHRRIASAVAEALFMERGTRCPDRASTMCTGGFGAAKLVVDDRTPGEESILARLSGGPAGVQADFGNPVESGGTGYSACIYASDDELVGALDVDRAGDTCGAGPCWLATGGVPGGRGFSFEDEAATSDGVRTIKLRTGAEGETSLLVRAANDASSGQTSVPSGIAARLEAATAPILQLFGSDIGCFTATIGTIKKSAPTLFRGTH